MKVDAEAVTAANEAISRNRLTGSDIKAMRIAKQWSQRKLATLTGISQGLISMMENETRSVSEDNESVLRKTLEYM